MMTVAAVSAARAAAVRPACTALAAVTPAAASAATSVQAAAAAIIVQPASAVTSAPPRVSDEDWLAGLGYRLTRGGRLAEVSEQAAPARPRKAARRAAVVTPEAAAEAAAARSRHAAVASAAAAAAKAPHGKEAAAKWLTGYLRERGGTVPSVQAKEAGQAAGFSQATLKKALPLAGVTFSWAGGTGTGSAVTVWSLAPPPG